jgi:5-methylcytosine-specific restriction enzyme A
MDAFLTADEEFQRLERAKARELRASAWWKNRVGSGRCYYCECAVHPSELSMDHKQPIVRGGRTTRTNVVPCCKVCNNEKGYRLLGEWLAERQAAGRPLACARNELY